MGGNGTRGGSGARSDPERAPLHAAALDRLHARRRDVLLAGRLAVGRGRVSPLSDPHTWQSRRRGGIPLVPPVGV